MPEHSRPPVKFDNPPVVEVVCGVQFQLERPLMAPHIGGFWDTIRPEFPNIQDVSPLQPFPGAPGTPELTFLTIPPLRRSWFLDDSGCHIVQLQEDRFLFNWKKNSESDEYPSYKHVISRFNERLAGFEKFLAEMKLGEFKITTLEMTYVNVVKASNGLDTDRPWKVLVDHQCGVAPNRFLPDPESFAWNTAYLLPQASGRLHVLAQSALLPKTGEKVLRLEVTARGQATDSTAVGRKSWFDLAHEWITHGFADITSPELHATHWKRSG